MEDREIVALYWAGSEQAIRESAQKYGRFCQSIAGRIVASPEDAEECVNDTWLRAWDAIPPARPEKLGAFFARITRNLALDRYRQQQREKRGAGEPTLCYEELQAVLGGGDPAQDAERLALRESLRRFLQGLPKRQRVIFLRRYWYFQPIREIAGDLGLSQSAVKMALLRARAALRQQLEAEKLL